MVGRGVTAARVRLGVRRWDPVSDDELDALDALGTKGRWTVRGHDLAMLPRPPGAGSAGVGADHLGRAGRPGPRPDRWTVRTVLDRTVGDPLGPRVGRAQKPPAL